MVRLLLTDRLGGLAGFHSLVGHPQARLPSLRAFWLADQGVGMVLAKDAVGAYGERVAARALVEVGMVIVARNWRCSSGEIDIIATDGPTIVFCEVKTRRSQRYGVPAEAVNPVKVRKLRALAATWLAVNPEMRGEVRFDLVSVWPQPAGPAHIEHLRGIF